MALLVEAGWGGLIQAPWTIAWTDISQYVDMVRGVSISRGASDEVSDIQPGTMTLALDNSDGRFTPGNPSSPYFPYVRRNSPIRAAVTTAAVRSGPAPWPTVQLADDFDDGRIDPVLWSGSYGGVTEVGGRARIPVVPGGFAAYQSGRQWKLNGSTFTIKIAALPGVSGSSAASVSVMANSVTAGTRAGFQYTPVTGALRLVSDVGYFDPTATVLAYSPVDHAWLRLREEGGNLSWDTSRDGVTWAPQRSIPTPAWVASDTLVIEMVGTRTGGTADYVEFDLANHRPRWRHWGMVNDWPTSWDGLLSTVTISSTDLFKRLNRLPPLRSCLAEEILLLRPLAYYPLTEPSDSTSAGDLSGTTAGQLGILQAGVGGTLEFGGTPGPAASGESWPTFAPASASAGKYLVADLGPDYAGASSGSWNHHECWFSTTTPGRVMMALTSHDQQFKFILSLSAGGALQIEYANEPGEPLTTLTTASGNLANGKPHHVAWDEKTNSLFVDNATMLIGDVPLMYRLQHLAVGGYQNTRLWSGSVGHVALYATPSGSITAGQLAEHYVAGTTAFAGEVAYDRVRRLASYAGISSVTVIGDTFDPIAGQGPGGTGALARMREVEKTESARLYAERDWYGLGYQSRDLRYNPDPLSEVFTIPYVDLETGSVELADDDQKLINIVDASRPGGATQRVSARESVAAFGPYEERLEVLKTSDNAALDAANWLVSRYADPSPELREVPIEAATLPYYSDVLDADISSYFSVTGLPPQAPASTMRVTVEGYTETIRNGSHLIQFRTSRSATDSVWVLGDAVYSVLDSTTRLAY